MKKKYWKYLFPAVICLGILALVMLDPFGDDLAEMTGTHVRSDWNKQIARIRIKNAEREIPESEVTMDSSIEIVKDYFEEIQLQSGNPAADESAVPDSPYRVTMYYETEMGESTYHFTFNEACTILWVGESEQVGTQFAVQNVSHVQGFFEGLGVRYGSVRGFSLFYPKAMPEDFNIRFEFGKGTDRTAKEYANVYDTYTATLKKEQDGESVSTAFQVSKDWKQLIYNQIVELGVYRIESCMTAETFDQAYQVDPTQPEELIRITFTANGKTYQVEGDRTAAAYRTNDEADCFVEFSEFLCDIYYGTTEYEQLGNPASLR